MNRERFEVRDIAERFEHGTMQRWTEINLSGRAVTEPKPHDVSANVPGL